MIPLVAHFYGMTPAEVGSLTIIQANMMLDAIPGVVSILNGKDPPPRRTKKSRRKSAVGAGIAVPKG